MTKRFFNWLFDANDRAFFQLSPFSPGWLDAIGEMLGANFCLPVVPFLLLYDAVIFFCHYSRVRVEEVAYQRAREERELETVQLQRERLAAEQARAEQERIRHELHVVTGREQLGQRFAVLINELRDIERLDLDDDTKLAMQHQHFSEFVDKVKELV